jgi:large conductance mechanosensitive channel
MVSGSDHDPTAFLATNPDRITSGGGVTRVLGVSGRRTHIHVVVVAIGLIVALAFSTVISAFTANIINPPITRAQGKHPVGLGIQLGSANNTSTFLNFGAFISAVIYFLILMAVVYFVIAVPYKMISARRGVVVFGEPAPAKICPACLSDDLPVAASKCKYCGTDQPQPEAASSETP